jgi:hypothetical protein
MHRRRFLSTTALGGLGLAALAPKAFAFTEEKCTTHAGDPACKEILRHETLLADLDAALAKKGLDAAQRHAVLAKAICPFCGELLIG